jgi:hypothetical protein
MTEPEQLKLPPELLPTYAEPFKPTTRTITRRGKRIKVETLDTGPDVQSRRRPRIRKRFTQFPGTWEEVLSKARVSNSTIWVAHVLIYEAWRSGKSTVKLTSRQAQKAGIEVARYEVEPSGKIIVITSKGDSAGVEPNPWNAEIAKLRAATPKGEGQQ